MRLTAVRTEIPLVHVHVTCRLSDFIISYSWTWHEICSSSHNMIRSSLRNSNDKISRKSGIIHTIKHRLIMFPKQTELRQCTKLRMTSFNMTLSRCQLHLRHKRTRLSDYPCVCFLSGCPSYRWTKRYAVNTQHLVS